MKIVGAERLTSKHNTRYEVTVEFNHEHRILSYSVPPDFEAMVSTSCDAALVALLIPAMFLGEDIQIEGTVSERLLTHLIREVQPILQIVIPSLNRVRITASNVSNQHRTGATGVATGFSAGVDSYSVLADHHYGEPAPSLRISHLLFNNTGSHGRDASTLFEQRYNRVEPIAKTIGLPLIKVNSNVDSFYSQEIGFQQTHTLRNMSVALMLQDGIAHFLYASSTHYTDLKVQKTHDIAFCDPIILPLLSTENLNAISSGSHHTRVQKTLKISRIKETQKNLDVCVNQRENDQYTNCGHCFKCLRTLTTLDIAGSIDAYSELFNIVKYKEHKERYLSKIQASIEPLELEVLRFAQESNCELPPPLQRPQPTAETILETLNQKRLKLQETKKKLKSLKAEHAALTPKLKTLEASVAKIYRNPIGRIFLPYALKQSLKQRKHTSKPP